MGVNIVTSVGARSDGGVSQGIGVLGQELGYGLADQATQGVSSASLVDDSDINTVDWVRGGGGGRG